MIILGSLHTWQVFEKANFPFPWKRVLKCESISSPSLTLLLHSLSPQTSVCPQSAKPTSWKVKTLVNLVVVFPNPQSPKQVNWWFFWGGGREWTVWYFESQSHRKKTALTKPMRRYTSFFPLYYWGNNFISQKAMRKLISCWKRQSSVG